MKNLITALLVGFFTLVSAACSAADHGPSRDTINTQLDTAQPISRIAFGSCSDARKPVPAFDAIANAKPDLMIFLGDNVYADTTDEAELRAAYQQLADNEYFQRLNKTAPVIATWDDLQ